MTVAALRAELEREEALWGLAMLRLPAAWERWEMAEPLIREHLRPAARIRVPLGLMPVWYRTLWWDATQIDGRATVDEVNEVVTRLYGARPSSTSLDTIYSVETYAFLDAVLSGAVGDAS